MSRYIEGQDRQQVTLLPECLDDFIAEDNTVRIVDDFINELDLVGLVFDGVSPAATGRPSYHPSVLLNLYLYGYLNRIQSSRMSRLDCCFARFARAALAVGRASLANRPVVSIGPDHHALHRHKKRAT